MRKSLYLILITVLVCFTACGKKEENPITAENPTEAPIQTDAPIKDEIDIQSEQGEAEMSIEVDTNFTEADDTPYPETEKEAETYLKNLLSDSDLFITIEGQEEAIGGEFYQHDGIVDKEVWCEEVNAIVVNGVSYYTDDYDNWYKVNSDISSSIISADIDYNSISMVKMTDDGCTGKMNFLQDTVDFTCDFETDSVYFTTAYDLGGLSTYVNVDISRADGVDSDYFEIPETYTDSSVDRFESLIASYLSGEVYADSEEYDESEGEAEFYEEDGVMYVD